ncbi:DUF1576 domain-containing protein [Vagococcus acidifermentans]|uniref:DUF1576 domain-containing protein n=1 Tax=Vagococcus acidifermentans TaxID=564710 RepID=A0A430AZB0_9ENTE|nr:DUF1576 domain-containing protein [Vagococcus acidifermentans]RSU13402.1 hypothetical protein CBF27_04280 [Vagococcus acidifermentans]
MENGASKNSFTFQLLSNLKCHTPNTIYILTFIYSSILILLGFMVERPENLLSGLYQITFNPGNLLTDYIEIANLGSALVNSGLTTIVSIFIIWFSKAPQTGLLTASLYTMCGFSFFGKNLLNSLPIILGVYLFSKYNKKPFANYILPSLFGTSLAPAVSMLAFGFDLPIGLGLFVGILAGLAIGFILPPLANHFVAFHRGFNLFNLGFTGGMVGMLYAAILRAFNLEIGTVSRISSGNNLFLAMLLSITCLFLCLLGFYYNDKSFRHYNALFVSHKNHMTDFTVDEGPGLALFNMGTVGLIGIAYIFLVGGNLDGPVVGALFTLIGFSAYRVQPFNYLPVLAGVFLASLFTNVETSSTGVLVAALFSSTLAPISSYYGIFAGIIAGALNLVLVNNVGILHGGVNLYNNGFSGGFVAAFLVPVLDKLQHKNWRKQLF